MPGCPGHVRLARPEYGCGLEIDDDLKPHVQQRSPSAIVRLQAPVLSTGPCNAFANCGNVFWEE
jgi:hypothetical protein